MSEQLKLVLKLKDQAEENARQQLARAEGQRDELQSQITALEDYVKDYQRQLSSSVQTSMQQKHILMSYIQQVQQAIAGHIERLNASHMAVGFAREAWLETKRQKIGIEKVVESRAEDEKRQEALREQKLSDEFVSSRRNNYT